MSDKLVRELADPRDVQLSDRTHTLPHSQRVAASSRAIHVLRLGPVVDHSMQFYSYFVLSSDTAIVLRTTPAMVFSLLS